jgi:CRISPR system Cascade subunit CasE
MYLSRIEIPWQRARNPYDVHRRLWELFPGQAREARQDANAPRQGFLYRFEEKSPGKPVRVLLQSRLAPQATTGMSLLGCREIHPRPEPEQRLAFLLTANPIKTIVDAEKAAKPDKISDKCRVPLLHEDEQLAWLSRKLDKAASVETATVQPHEPLHFRKGNRAGKLVTATFEGLLRVQDPDTLLKHLHDGIGPAKSFGCGLLLVRRIP